MKNDLNCFFLMFIYISSDIFQEWNGKMDIHLMRIKILSDELFKQSISSFKLVETGISFFFSLIISL